VEFLHLKLRAESLAIGERIKKRTFRPCLETLPSSVISGAWAEYFPGAAITGVGFLNKESYEKTYFVHSPREYVTNSSSLPITVEYLTPRPGWAYIEGDVYCPAVDGSADLASHLPFDIHLGGLRYKGFGRCHISLDGVLAQSLTRGCFRGRIRETEVDLFDVKVRFPRYGYLFEPDPSNRGLGQYRRAIFEGSLVEAPLFMISEEYFYE